MRTWTAPFSGIVALAGLLCGCNLGVPAGSAPAASGAAEQIAIETALDSAKTIALLAHAVRPAGDLQAIFEQGKSFPDCPRLAPSFDGNTIDLSLEFGTGCSVYESAGPRIGGRLAGQYFAGTHSFQFTATQIQNPGHTQLDGSATGSFAFPGEIVINVTIDVSSSASSSVRGTARVHFGPTDGVIRISEASVTVDGAASARAVSFRNLTIDSRDSGGLLPSSGSATVTETAALPPVGAVSLEFSEQTPRNGSVRVISPGAAQ